MAEKDTTQVSAEKAYYEDVPPPTQSFHVKGAAHAEWGLKDRLSRIFSPKTGHTVMLAFDHGYIMGPTTGLERMDIVIPKLAPHIDVFMATRGALRTCVPPTFNKGIALRSTAGPSILADDVTDEVLAVDIEDAIRMNASCMAIQTFIGSPFERQTIDNLNRAINAGNRYAIATLGVVAVGKQMERTTRFFLLATRMLAEFGVHLVKTYYCDDFKKVVAACPVPIVIAGGKKLPEDEALTLAYNAIGDGAAGVDMGRNIFQAGDPVAMVQAIGKVVHEGYTDKRAYEFYRDTAGDAKPANDEKAVRRGGRGRPKK